MPVTPFLALVLQVLYHQVITSEDHRERQVHEQFCSRQFCRAESEEDISVDFPQGDRARTSEAANSRPLHQRERGDHRQKLPAAGCPRSGRGMPFGAGIRVPATEDCARRARPWAGTRSLSKGGGGGCEQLEPQSTQRTQREKMTDRECTGNSRMPFLTETLRPLRPLRLSLFRERSRRKEGNRDVGWLVKKYMRERLCPNTQVPKVRRQRTA
jgi:hypothetical protein